MLVFVIKELMTGLYKETSRRETLVEWSSIENSKLRKEEELLGGGSLS
jgi:hypothetical protein